MTQKHETLVAQYEQAVQLYQHEDNLTWHKMQQSVYVNGALATVVGIDLVHDMRWLVASGAAVFSVLFLLTVEGSRRYMFARQAAVREGEQALCSAGGTTPLIVDVRTSRLVPSTSFSIRIFLWLMVLAWTALAIYWIRGI